MLRIGVNPATIRSVATFLITVSSLLAISPQRTQAVACNPPESGDYTVNQSCSFPNSSSGNAIDGVYKGDMILPEGTTLTINAGQTVCWDPDGLGVFRLYALCEPCFVARSERFATTIYI